jgi:hypothetical protein
MNTRKGNGQSGFAQKIAALVNLDSRSMTERAREGDALD